MQTADFGVKLDFGSIRKILGSIYDALGIEGTPREFIGSHPLSLTQSSIQTLLSEDYLVCEKSDGIRVMLIVLNGNVYLYDRNSLVYQTKYHLRGSELYIVDGEMYKESESYVFAIFDTLVFRDKACLSMNLNKRLQRAFEFAQNIVPKQLLLHAKHPSLSFRIIAKPMMKSYGFYQILDGIPELEHENDGLIFTPVKDPYVVMKRSRTFKWKPPHLNTVDFYVIKGEKMFTWNLCVSVEDYQLSGGNTMRSSGLLFFDVFYDLSGSLGEGEVIAEFSYDDRKENVDVSDFTVTHGGWVLYKIRTDKKTPNNLKTVLNVLESIKECIGEKELRAHWKEMAANYKKRQLESV